MKELNFAKINNVLKGLKKMAYLLILQDMSNCCNAKTELKIKLVMDISWQPQKSSLPDVTVPIWVISEIIMVIPVWEAVLIHNILPAI